MKVEIFHHIVDACVEFLKKLDPKYAAIILHYYCDQPSSFSQARSACGVHCSTERLVLSVVGAYVVRTSSLNEKHSCQLFIMGLCDKTTPTLTPPLIIVNKS